MHSYVQLLKHFEDRQSAPLSIHSLCKEGTLRAGDWIGPNAICYAFKYLFDANKEAFNNMKLHVCRDGNIFLDEIEKLSIDNSGLLLLIPLQLGIQKTIEN